MVILLNSNKIIVSDRPLHLQFLAIFSLLVFLFRILVTTTERIAPTWGMRAEQQREERRKERKRKMDEATERIRQLQAAAVKELQQRQKKQTELEKEKEKNKERKE